MIFVLFALQKKIAISLSPLPLNHERLSDLHTHLYPVFRGNTIKIVSVFLFCFVLFCFVLLLLITTTCNIWIVVNLQHAAEHQWNCYLDCAFYQTHTPVVIFHYFFA